MATPNAKSSGGGIRKFSSIAGMPRIMFSTDTEMSYERPSEQVNSSYAPEGRNKATINIGATLETTTNDGSVSTKSRKKKKKKKNIGKNLLDNLESLQMHEMGTPEKAVDYEGTRFVEKMKTFQDGISSSYQDQELASDQGTALPPVLSHLEMTPSIHGDRRGGKADGLKTTMDLRASLESATDIYQTAMSVADSATSKGRKKKKKKKKRNNNGDDVASASYRSSIEKIEETDNERMDEENLNKNAEMKIFDQL